MPLFEGFPSPGRGFRAGSWGLPGPLGYGPHRVGLPWPSPHRLGRLPRLQSPLFISLRRYKISLLWLVCMVWLLWESCGGWPGWSFSGYLRRAPAQPHQPALANLRTSQPLKTATRALEILAHLLSVVNFSSGEINIWLGLDSGVPR